MLFSPFILSASYLLHLIATVVWIGGLVTLALIVQPIAQQLLDPAARAQLLEAAHNRFRPLANISLIVLLLTGLVQLVANKFYKGFLEFDNSWSVAILLKHGLVVVMIGLAAFMQFSVEPALRRNTLLAAHDLEDPTLAKQLQKQQVRLTRINLTCSVLVLIFTAIARAQTQ